MDDTPEILQGAYQTNRMRDRLTRLKGGAQAPGGLAHGEPGTPYVCGRCTRAKGKTMTCVLRTLNLCDGQVLEQSDHALTGCPHKILSDDELRGLWAAADRLLLAETQEALPRTSTRPR